jgi:hypothetical protein
MMALFAFIPNVAHGWLGRWWLSSYGTSTSVIKQFPDGTEVAVFTIIRGRNNLPPDGPSGDSHFGEMVLDDTY